MYNFIAIHTSFKGYTAVVSLWFTLIYPRKVIHYPITYHIAQNFDGWKF